MKKQVENLLRTEKERISASEKQKRDKHLISIGLIDKEKKTGRNYRESYADGTKWDPDKGLFYKESFGALDVTDEEYAEICKYFPPSKVGKTSSEVGVKSRELKANASATKFFAGLLMVGGVIGAIICLTTFTWVEVVKHSYYHGGFEIVTEFNPIGLITAISILLVSWALAAIIAILNTILAEIYSKV